MSEGRGESQPAAHSPEFQSHNLRSGAVLNGGRQPGQAGRLRGQALTRARRRAIERGPGRISCTVMVMWRVRRARWACMTCSAGRTARPTLAEQSPLLRQVARQVLHLPKNLPVSVSRPATHLCCP